jgi:hypothetical protein
MVKQHSIAVTITSIFYIILFSIFTLVSLLYGWTTFFGNQSSAIPFWINAGTFLFKLVFTDWSWLFIVALVISLAGLYASISLLKRKKWSRTLFLFVSAFLFPWCVFRIFDAFQKAPTFLNIQSIVSNNPLEKIPSLIYFSSSIVMAGIGIISLLSFIVLFSRKNDKEFL